MGNGVPIFTMVDLEETEIVHEKNLHVQYNLAPIFIYLYSSLIEMISGVLFHIKRAVIMVMDGMVGG